MKNEKLIEKMTLEEKASLISGKNFWETMNIDSLNIPSMFLSDGPHGLRKQAVDADNLGLGKSVLATCFPTAASLANSWDERLAEEVGQALGTEAAANKVSVLLGPGTNIKRNPLCGRNFEYFSEEPYLAGKMSAGMIRGIESKEVSACVKHFAANNQEARRMVLDSVVDERTLREIYLQPFEIAVKEGKTRAVMTSYNKVNGEYANENKHLLNDILRNEWGFDGVVVSDWGGCNDRVEGIRCTSDLEMPSSGGETCRDVIAAVKEGRLSESDLDGCVDRLLTLIFKTDETLKNSPSEFNESEHHDLAQKAAENSVVLLKNENNVLPLKAAAKVAVIGDFASKPRYQGAGSSMVNPTKLVSTLECIGGYDLEFKGFAKGFDRFGKKSKSLSKNACALAKTADIVLLYLGLDEIAESEGLDRKHMHLAQNQIDLLKQLKETGKKIVVILSCGSSVETEWACFTDALILASLSGQAGAKAVLNVVTGSVNPSGKLAESYPVKYEDCSASKGFPFLEETAEYREGLYVGYRYYDTQNIPVSFPFGFGLSYTSFAYSDIAVSENGASFTLKNTGVADGAEVAQLYIGANDGKVFRPKKELKGFKKVFLKAGEEARVSIPFDDKTFRYFDTDTNKWEVESCEYGVYICSSCADIRLSGKIKIDGTITKAENKDEKLSKYFTGDVKNITDEEFKALLRRGIPNPHTVFVKKKRIVVGVNTTIEQLRYSKGWLGRFFAFIVRVVKRFSKENILIMGVYHLPLRGISRMTGGALNWEQLQALIVAFNGKFFKGLRLYLKARKKRRKERKLEKRLTKKS